MYSTMGKSQLNIRIGEALADALDKRTESTGKTKTAIVSEALASYLNVDAEKSELDIIHERLEALEAKFKGSQKNTVQNKAKVQPERGKQVEINVDELGELITKQEASSITGYSVNTLNRTFSQNNILEVEKRGKAGLYRKDEVLNRIGIK